MDFTRKRIKGQSQKHHKLWLSKEQYRIIWRDMCCEIEVLPRYQATVRVVLPNGIEMWDFVSSRRLFKTMNAAKDACEKHYRLWSNSKKPPNKTGRPLWMSLKSH